MSVETTKATALEMIRDYVAENGRGCPKYILQAKGIPTRTISEMVDAGMIEAGRGREGGLFPAGQRPEPRTDGSTSLRQEMMAWINAALAGHVNRDEAIRLQERLAEESNRRSEARMK